MAVETNSDQDGDERDDSNSLGALSTSVSWCKQGTPVWAARL